MTDDEREAREWLLRLQEPGATSARWAANARTILALLDAPRLPRPEDVPASVMVPIADRFGFPYADFRCLYRALYDHYTKPAEPEPVVAKAKPPTNPDAEFAALHTVFGALNTVGEKTAIARVLRYMAQRFGVTHE